MHSCASSTRQRTFPASSGARVSRVRTRSRVATTVRRHGCRRSRGLHGREGAPRPRESGRVLRIATPLRSPWSPQTKFAPQFGSRGCRNLLSMPPRTPRTCHSRAPRTWAWASRSTSGCIFGARTRRCPYIRTARPVPRLHTSRRISDSPPRRPSLPWPTVRRTEDRAALFEGRKSPSGPAIRAKSRGISQGKTQRDNATTNVIMKKARVGPGDSSENQGTFLKGKNQRDNDKINVIMIRSLRDNAFLLVETPLVAVSRSFFPRFTSSRAITLTRTLAQLPNTHPKKP